MTALENVLLGATYSKRGKRESLGPGFRMSEDPQFRRGEGYRLSF